MTPTRAALGVVVWCAVASADPIALPDTQAVLDLPAPWTRIDHAPGLVAAYRTDAGHVLAVTRAQVPNIDAWRTRTRAAYADQIERGVAAGIPKYRRLTRKLGDANGVPALDLEARGSRGVVVIRILLFRTYALALAIELPRGAALAEARAIARRFAPPPPTAP